MKALILYVFFVAFGTVLAILVGLFVERQISSGVSTLVFLVLFFSNLVTSWIAVILVMDGPLRNIRGMTEQLEAEREGRLRDPYH
jgi:hypothetical protein